ncbi:hypothetical protein SAMN05444398_107182 [Roseovarius pacificus]|uniref:SPW repeat-containing protein n=2 Tax=Roseovarius pacificus TaxID=337701 RepID=A0A1M7ESB6_9RHOB|nr:hypothetical protein [Roseovarius pacificus]GGO57545.1 hypothetical protein GCM10011315_24960 [Roseovarius pacificus]SHL94379.1 hypothetical protein SAMN05444398_107182 [Roseovarius pacificus]
MTDLGHRFSLQAILAIDAATCAIMGALLVFASEPIAGLTGIPEPFLFVAGLLLLPIAVFMAVFARVATIPAWAVQMVVAGNVLWVLGSVILPIAGLIAPNGLGWAFLLVQAVAVAIFASLEWAARQYPASCA